MAHSCEDLLKRSRRQFLSASLGGGAGLLAGPFSASGSATPKANEVGGTSVEKQPPSPPWTKDLILYELQLKGFTSPGGPETGTFESLRAKLPYLEELGVTGIWMGVPWLSDSHFYYNIWTHYAVLEPDKLDPSLGTEEQFKRMIEEAHQRGIRLFLDVRNVRPSG